MKTVLVSIFTLLSIVALCNPKGDNNKVRTATKVVVVAAQENITSDYYPISMIAEQMKISEDSVVNVLNGEVIASIVKDNPEFMAQTDRCVKDDMTEVLSLNDAQYVLVISKYDIDRRVEPFMTIFHHIKYTLYDKDGKEVLNATNYFNTMEVAGIDTMRSPMRKCTRKIAQSVMNKIQS